MPKVPQYNSPQVAPTNLPSARVQTTAPEGAFGSYGFVDTANKAIGGIADFALREKLKADQLRSQEADSQLSQLQNELQTEAEKNFKGANAAGALDFVRTEWDKRFTEVEKGLANDEQRLATRQKANDRWGAIQRHLEVYTSQEQEKYDDQITESFRKNEQSLTLKNFTDEGFVNDSIKKQQEAEYQRAYRKGYANNVNGETNPLLKSALEEVTSTTRFNVISQYVSQGDDLKAKELFDKYQDELSVAHRLALTRGLKESSSRSQSRKLSDEILSEYGNNLAGALKAAEAIEDTDLHDLTKTRIKAHFDEKRATRAYLEDELYLKATNLIDSKDARGSGKSAREIVSATTWSQLSLGHREALEKRLSGVSQNDNKAWLEFLDKDGNDLSRMSRVDFETKYWSKFDESHRAKAETQWNAAREAKGDQEKLTQLVTPKEEIEHHLLTNKLITPETGKRSTREIEFYTKFQDAAQNAINEFEREKLGGKRKATREERAKVLKDLTTETVFIEGSGWLSDKEVMASLVTQDEVGRAYVPFTRIPNDSRSDIKAYAEKKGYRSPTIAQMQRAYAAIVRNDRELADRILRGQK